MLIYFTLKCIAAKVITKNSQKFFYSVFIKYSPQWKTSQIEDYNLLKSVFMFTATFVKAEKL
jgi:hypothetical protein